MADFIIEQIQTLWQTLSTYPADAHWYCPKVDSEDSTNYDDLDYDDDAEDGGTTSAEKKVRIENWRTRQSFAYKMSVYYGLQEDDAGEVSSITEMFETKKQGLLTKCDSCVKHYHLGRKGYLKYLSENFEEDIVEALIKLVEDNDIARIEKGLDICIKALTPLAAEKRGMRALPQPGLTALFEALCMKEYHTEKPGLLYAVLSIMQTATRPLRLAVIVPAMGSYLFDSDPVLHRLATICFQKPPQKVTKEIFEWVIQDALVKNMVYINTPGRSREELDRFWSAVVLILSLLDKELVTHSLRGLDVSPDIYHLALQHLSVGSEYTVRSILDAFVKLLDVAPEAFWSAYGAISPTAVAEQVFNSPSYPRLLEYPKPEGLPQAPELSSALAWVQYFMKSIKVELRYQACESMLNSFFKKFGYRPGLPMESNMACLQAALLSIDITLSSFAADDYVMNPSTTFIAVGNSIKMVDTHREAIINMATLPKGAIGYAELAGSALNIVQNTLVLNSKTLKAEFQALCEDKDVQHGDDGNSLSLWQGIADAIKPDRLDLVKAVLVGIRPLIGLDKFPTKKRRPDQPPPRRRQYNTAIDQMSDVTAKILQRISDFPIEDQRALYRDLRCSQPLLGGLMTAHEDTFAAAVELLKTVTNGESRREAVRGILDMSLGSSLVALKHTADMVHSLRTFQALPMVVKTGVDTLSGLCNSQTGVLRSRSVLIGFEKQALHAWWKEQWNAIDMAYAMTSEWSEYMDLGLLKDFCRDAMEYADRLFDEYKIISVMMSKQSEEKSSDPDSQEAIRKQVLERPRRSLRYLVMWLRLSDSYLVATVVSLVSKLLRSLGELGLRIDKETHEYIDKVLYKRVNTIVQPQQRSILKQALVENFGKEDSDDEPEIIKVQTRLDGWSKSANGAVHDPSRSGSSTPGKQEVVDLDKWRAGTKTAIRDDTRSLSGSIEQGKLALDQIKARQQRLEAVKSAKSKTLAETEKAENAKAIESLKAKRQREKEEKRQRDAIEIAKARALRTPTVKGEGSGLAALAGAIGKIHAPVRNEMMVSSEEEEDSDDDEDEMALIRKVKGPKALSDFEKQRRAAARLPQGPVKKTKIIRSQIEMRARLTPDMTGLHKTILSWDIFHEGDSPPEAPECVDLPAKFRNYQDYQTTMYPLLVSEAWMSLSTELETARQSNGIKGRLFTITLKNRMSVDSFMEISTTMTPADNKEVQIGDADIVILSEAPEPLNYPKAPHCLARVHAVTRKKNVVEVTYRVRSEAVSGANGLSIVPEKVIRGFKLTSITSIEREYSAMKSLQHYDLCNEILDAEPSQLLKYNDNVLQPIMATYGLNKGQAAAVKSAKDNDAFTLIQGPPGTGKTKTIVAMIGALLTGLAKPVQSVPVGRPLGPPARAQPGPVPKKLLVCAPSNAAVDELVSRLMEGIVEMTGEKRKIKPLRLGRSDKINAAIREVTLDGQLEKRLQAHRASGNDALAEKNKLHERAAEVKAKLADLRPRLDEARKVGDKAKEGQLQRDFDVLKREQSRIGAKIDDDKDQGNTVARENEITRRRIQQEILNEADVLCSTLSGSGHDMFKNLSIEFETVIIDEAAQSIEISSLIPLKYGCTKCIMVGDPKQLPPTVLSSMSAQYGYEKSLFVRMQSAFPDRVHMLDTQYRMHPEISSFPSKSFYDSQLLDGPNLAKLRLKPWHSKELLGPYRFFDVKGTATRAGKSMVNRHEIEVAIQIYSRLKSAFPNYDFRNKIGIITPYKGQLNQLRRDLTMKYGEGILDEIDTNTTDAYQGREAEIIIFSCVRAEADRGIGFLNDIRRMNVGLTRAKSSMWVLGDSNALRNGKFWRLLLEDAQARGLYTDGDLINLLRRPLKDADNYRPSPNQDVVMEDVDAAPRHKGPVRRRSADIVMTDAPSIKDERPPSNSSTTLNSAPTKAVKPENFKTESGKRTREPSPNDSGPPRKVPTLPSGIPGLRIPGQPKPSKQLPAVPKTQAPATAPTRVSNLPARPALPPPGGPKKMLPRRKPADPFLPSKPKPRQP